MLFKVYEIGIHGKCWRIFWNIYQDMESCVVVNGVGSRKFKMKRGIRQGSALSAQLYLIFIDGLLREVESSKRGAMLTDLTVNIPTQADDICLVAYKSTDMTDLNDICENYSKLWRFNFSPGKSAAMYLSGKSVRHNRSNPSFNLFGNEIKKNDCETCWSNFII